MPRSQMVDRETLTKGEVSRCITDLLQLFAVVVCLAYSAVNDASPFDTKAARQSLNPLTSFVVEPQPLDMDQAQRLDPSAWQPVEGTVNDGYTRTGHWFRTTLTNTSNEALDRFFEVGYPLLDHIEFYQTIDGRIIKSTVTGDQWPFNQRPVASTSFAFPITIPAGTTTQIYLRVATEGSLQAP
jgi:diguanylate cyclase